MTCGGVQGISTAALDMFKRLENEMKPTKNYQLYRERMHKLKREHTPLLPWLGIAASSHLVPTGTSAE
jgi:hypothetical protein